MRLKDRIAVVTGAGQGMGRAIAQRFAHEGATVVAIDVNLAAAEETLAGSPGLAQTVGVVTTAVAPVPRRLDDHRALRAPHFVPSAGGGRVVVARVVHLALPSSGRAVTDDPTECDPSPLRYPVVPVPGRSGTRSSTRARTRKEPPAVPVAPRRSELSWAQMTRTFWASSPFLPGATSNSTFWPSSRLL